MPGYHRQSLQDKDLLRWHLQICSRGAGARPPYSIAASLRLARLEDEDDDENERVELTEGGGWPLPFRCFLRHRKTDPCR
jgi:hypothetical protein